MNYRKLINTLHLWLGLVSGTVLLIVALTGCIMAFEDEIRNLTQHDQLWVKKENKAALDVQSVIAVLKKYDSKIKLNQLRYYGNPERTIQCYTKDKKIYAVDPYNGTVLGYRDQEKDWLTVVLSVHRTLLLGKTGEEIIFWNVWIFLLMLLSGLFLWVPRRIKQMRQNLTIKKGASSKRRNYDLHSVLGFYAWLPLMLIAVTGIDMASGRTREAKQKSLIIAGIRPATGVYDSALRQAYHNELLEVLRITFPKDSTDVISVSIRYSTHGFRKQNTFAFDRYTARLLKTDEYKNKSFRERFFGSDYEIHTGRIAGFAGKLVMFLAALVAISLPVTGFLIWKGKRKKGTAKKTGRAAVLTTGELKT